MTQDEQQLDLLSIFHYVAGGINAIFSCFPFIHLAIGIAMLYGGKSFPVKEQTDETGAAPLMPQQ